LQPFDNQSGNAMGIDLTVNGVRRSVNVAPETPLLWVIRDHLGLTGTKFSCGIAQCGACTLHIDGRPARSCSVPVSAAAGKAVTTIEGLSVERMHPVQAAWSSTCRNAAIASRE
jgi:aerobic-type carbon monoxide dehydrogenase small subunit (CoxS/CutS family)